MQGFRQSAFRYTIILLCNRNRHHYKQQKKMTESILLLVKSSKSKVNHKYMHGIWYDRRQIYDIRTNQLHILS